MWSMVPRFADGGNKGKRTRTKFGIRAKALTRSLLGRLFCAACEWWEDTTYHSRRELSATSLQSIKWESVGPGFSAPTIGWITADCDAQVEL
jgi:hypothetical protein